MDIQGLWVYIADPPAQRDANDVAKQAKYDVDSAKVYGYIMATIEDKVRIAIETHTKKRDGVEAWKYIIKLYKREDRLYINQLKNDLLKVWLKELENGGDLDEY